MIEVIDLNTIDVVDNVLPILIPDNYVNYEELVANEDVIKEQYINFENLGINLINNIDVKFKQDIFANMINYINENYLSIGDYDATTILPIKLLETGEYIYNFICVDCYNTIIPNFLTMTNCMSLDSFDALIKNKYKGDYSIVKTNLVKTIKTIVEELMKLQRIDKSIQQDEIYQKMLMKYTYYIDLADFGNTEKFIESYFKPLLMKNFDSILWRIM